MSEVQVFKVEEKDHVITVTVEGADDALQWAVTDKVKTAPVGVVKRGSVLIATTRDKDAAAEIVALLQASGYRG